MKRVFICVCTVFMSFNIIAQNDVDALRYSRTSIFGTARGLGAAGALGAIGGDLTSLSLNPAGLGIYRSSEVSLSLGLNAIKTESEYLNNASLDYKFSVNIPNFGFVFNNLYYDNNKVRTTGWVSTSFAIGMNRINNFHERIFYEGVNTENSIMDKFVQELNNRHGGEGTTFLEMKFGEEDISTTALLGYDAFVINPVSDSFFIDTTQSFQFNHILSGSDVIQQQVITTKGAMNEYAFSFGANYSNRLYLGATLGIPTIRFNYRSSYTEEPADTNMDFQEMRFTDNFNTSGTGVNLKLGAIYRVNDWFRAGLAFHTPTVFALEETFEKSWRFTFQSDELFRDSDDMNLANFNEYTLITPSKIIGSLGFIIMKRGFIGVDYEWVDYSSSRLIFDEDGKSWESFVNSAIANKYNGTSAFRIGGEYNIDNVQLRAGYAYEMSPFKSGIGVEGADESRHNITLGSGYRQDDFFVDFAFVKSLSDRFHEPFSIPGESTSGAEININKTRLILTGGFKF